MRAEYSSPGDFLPYRANLTLQAWVAICDAHLDTYTSLRTVERLSAEAMMVQARHHKLAHVLTYTQIQTPYGELAPYMTLYDDLRHRQRSLQQRLEHAEAAYADTRDRHAALLDDMLQGRILSAVATERNEEGFRIETRFGALTHVRVRSVRGPYHSFDPAYAILRLGSDDGGVDVQLMTPGSIYERHADLYVHRSGV